jgi:hypothetical protein
VHDFATLKGKQFATKVSLICLPSSNLHAKSRNVDSIKKVVEVLDQNLSPPEVNKTKAYESK